MRLLAHLFKGLKAVHENGETLLDRSMILYGSNLGDANAHSTANMPVLLAGGFRHAGPSLLVALKTTASKLVRFRASPNGHRDYPICLIDRHDVGPGYEESMTGGVLRTLLPLLSAALFASAAQEVVVDFEKAVPLLADRKANRVPQYEERALCSRSPESPRPPRRKAC
jgi:hypothetical protein